MQRVGGMPIQNSFRKKPGIKNSSKVRIGSPLGVWRLLFTNKMMIKIIKYTNEKAKQADLNLELTTEELLRFLGLYMRRGLCMRKTPIQFIWSNRYGNEFFKRNMSRNRFNLIKKFLRFDSQIERSRNKNDDCFIHVRDIFETFTTNSIMLKQKKQIKKNEKIQNKN